jgi:dihydroorotase-like cyclic amidohydrolase
MTLDTAIRGGTVVVAGDTMRCDVGIRAGQVVIMAERIEEAARIIDATGKYVLPGGVDAHVHIAQPSGAGIVMAEASGQIAPRYHDTSRPIPVEREATHRAISLAEIADTPLVIVHVSNREAMEQIRWAQNKGLNVIGETCTQYLVLTADDLDGLDMQGAKYVCSPPPRDLASQEACWEGPKTGMFSSDHCPFRVDETGKLVPKGKSSFRWVPNGIPGVGSSAAHPVLRGCHEEAHRPAELRRRHGHQSRQDLRPLSAQGYDRGGLRCRHRDLGPRAAGAARSQPHPGWRGLHAL